MFLSARTSRLQFCKFKFDGALTHRYRLLLADLLVVVVLSFEIHDGAIISFFAAVWRGRRFARFRAEADLFPAIAPCRVVYANFAYATFSSSSPSLKMRARRCRPRPARARRSRRGAFSFRPRLADERRGNFAAMARSEGWTLPTHCHGSRRRVMHQRSCREAGAMRAAPTKR